MQATMTEEHYGRTASGKSWRSKPFKTKVKKINGTFYHNMTDERTQRCFRRVGGSERAARAYTSQGYLITRLTSINPDRSLKIVRFFNNFKR